MNKLTEHIKSVDWSKGIITKEEAIKFINRFAQCLLKYGIRQKERQNEDKNHS